MKNHLYRYIGIVCLIALALTLSIANYAFAEETQTVIDMAGREIVLPKAIERVSCMSATCETAIVAMGQADKLIYSSAFGSGDFSFTNKLFPDLVDVPKETTSLSNEALLEQNVDVVFVKSMSNVERLERGGINVVYLEFNNIEQTKCSIQLIGQIFDVPEIANEYIGYIEKFLPIINERLHTIPDNEKIRVYVPLLRSNSDTILNTYDPSHITTELFDLCGAYVITQDISFTDNNGILTEEALIAQDPDVIFLCGFYREKGYELLKNGQYDGILSAVDNNKIYYFPLGMYDWSAGGFELGIAGLWCAKVLYPDLFADIDIYQITKEYYFNTTGTLLTDDDIAYVFHE